MKDIYLLKLVLILNKTHNNVQQIARLIIKLLLVMLYDMFARGNTPND